MFESAEICVTLQSHQHCLYKLLKHNATYLFKVTHFRVLSLLSIPVFQVNISTEFMRMNLQIDYYLCLWMSLVSHCVTKITLRSLSQKRPIPLGFLDSRKTV